MDNPSIQIARFEVHNFELPSDTVHENPFAVQLSATFTHASGVTLKVPGFYDGNGVWQIRFSPTLEGAWRGVVASDDAILAGVGDLFVACLPNENTRVHGRLVVDEKTPHRFLFEDGSVCIPLGFEWDWMTAYHQVHGGEETVDRENPTFDEAVDLLCDGGFNYVMANLYAHYYHRTEISERTENYLYQRPEHYLFDGTNDDPDHTRLNVGFFQMFDRAVAALHERGVVLHLMIQVQNKKVNWPEWLSDEDDQFWAYVIKRYQAYSNVIWDISKETYNLLNRSGSHDYALSRIALIREVDGYGNLITAHDTERESWGKETVVDAACDFVSDQVKFGGTVEGWEMASAYKLNREAVRRWRNIEKPYLNMEYGYEVGEPPLAAPIPKMTMSGETMLLWTWALYVGGAYANYYYCNTSWDINRFYPIPESWTRFRFLTDFLTLMDFNCLVPDNDYVDRGMCSAEPGKQYFVFLPEGGNTQIDLSTIESGANVSVVWMDIWTGERVEEDVADLKFTTGLGNPLSNSDAPCVFYLNVKAG
ncbi:MAG: DUF5060 domain-containing protein [Candidatus Latescibacteria bacterium]|nr:DUF5060 domain-containing protein [Candidatus Latescibacterota bacterium]MBT5832835.1 DUF5060 domain-containing protein [Candidatus Latescibacterota bacterium]